MLDPGAFLRVVLKESLRAQCYFVVLHFRTTFAPLDFVNDDQSRKNVLRSLLPARPIFSLPDRVGWM